MNRKRSAEKSARIIEKQPAIIKVESDATWKPSGLSDDTASKQQLHQQKQTIDQIKSEFLTMSSTPSTPTTPTNQQQSLFSAASSSSSKTQQRTSTGGGGGGGGGSATTGSISRTMSSSSVVSTQTIPLESASDKLNDPRLSTTTGDITNVDYLRSILSRSFSLTNGKRADSSSSSATINEFTTFADLLLTVPKFGSSSKLSRQLSSTLSSELQSASSSTSAAATATITTTAATTTPNKTSIEMYKSRKLMQQQQQQQAQVKSEPMDEQSGCDANKLIINEQHKTNETAAAAAAEINATNSTTTSTATTPLSDLRIKPVKDEPVSPHSQLTTAIEVDERIKALDEMLS
jgi:hypothetical protein